MPLAMGDRHLRLRPHFVCRVVPNDGVFLLSDAEAYVLRGRVYEELVPLLDGGSAVNGLDALIAGGRHPGEIYYALDTLERKGYIEEVRGELPRGEAAFWNAAGLNTEAASARLRSAAVRTIVAGDIERGAFERLLQSSGVAADDSALRWIVLAPDYLHPDVERVATEARTGGASWLLCKPVGAEIWVGPLFGSTEGPCWQCLAHRLRGNRKVRSYIERNGGPLVTSAGAAPQLASTVQLAFGIAATQVARWTVLGSAPELDGAIVTLDTVTLAQKRHIVTRRPQCLVCGDAGLVARQQSTAVAVGTRAKAFTSDGGHRTAAPEQTVRKLGRHISAITGLVDAVHSSSTFAGGSELVQSYAVGRICGRRDFRKGRTGRERAAGGKGMNSWQAQASALAEAMERYSGEFQGDEAVVAASYRDLGAQAIHPNECLLFSDAQYRDREPLNAAETAVEQIPEPLDKSAVIDWSPVWPLCGGPVRYLPASYCFYDADGPGARFASADSNGAAAGNCKEEAILQGFLELVERDAVALWWYNRASRPGVDLAGFEDPYIAALLEFYGARGRDLWALDLTSDLGIPVFAAVSRRNDKPAEDILLGFGAHLDPKLALLRALTEINQALPGVAAVSASAPDDYAGSNQSAIHWWRTATLESEPYLAPAAGSVATRRSSYAPSDDLGADVGYCIEAARRRGLTTYVIDQTRPDTGLDVVKVIVPGLRHFRPRFAPGRLYDVPVELQWIARPRGEDELNRHAIYF